MNERASVNELSDELERADISVRGRLIGPLKLCPPGADRFSKAYSAAGALGLPAAARELLDQTVAMVALNLDAAILHRAA
jgi:hypothetical protein